MRLWNMWIWMGVWGVGWLYRPRGYGFSPKAMLKSHMKHDSAPQRGLRLLAKGHAEEAKGHAEEAHEA